MVRAFDVSAKPARSGYSLIDARGSVATVKKLAYKVGDERTTRRGVDVDHGALPLRVKPDSGPHENNVCRTWTGGNPDGTSGQVRMRGVFESENIRNSGVRDRIKWFDNLGLRRCGVTRSGWLTVSANALPAVRRGKYARPRVVCDPALLEGWGAIGRRPQTWHP